MKLHARTLLVGAAVLALGLWVLAAGSQGGGGNRADTRALVQKLADAIEKGDADQANKLVEEISKADLEDVMNLMSKRGGKKEAFGFGPTPGASKDDGIELKVGNLAKRAPAPAQAEKESKAIMEMAYRVAAISAVAKAKAPEKDEGDKKKKDWLEYADSMRKSAEELAEAAKEKKGPEIKAAAAKLNSACNNCHGKFRD